MSSLPADALRSLALAGPAALAATHARARLQSIDVLRGLVIVLMALDHVRAYFTGVRFDPLDLSQTDPALFLTRWVTHLCAPTFIFLAGVSAYLMSRRCDQRELRRFLLTRGLWLIVLEFTVIQFAWSFNFRYEVGLIMQVIWAIGASMIALAALVHLPRWAIGFIAALMLGGHNLLDGALPETFGQWAWLWNVIHVQGRTSFAFILYPSFCIHSLDRRHGARFLRRRVIRTRRTAPPIDPARRWIARDPVGCGSKWSMKPWSSTKAKCSSSRRACGTIPLRTPSATYF
jgi:uncharacterized membrane protein